MKRSIRQNKPPLLAGPAGLSPDPIRSMHPFWGNTRSITLSACIQKNSQEGDLLLDPFGGSAAAAVEALRLNRRIIILDHNPVTAFITEVVLKPVNLPRLKWALEDVQAACREEASRLFSTVCSACGRIGVIEFVLRENGEPVQIAYQCGCSRGRLYKTPDAADRQANPQSTGPTIPFRHPADIPLSASPSGAPASANELYTGRVLAVLSRLHSAIGKVDDPSSRDVLRLAFAVCLEPCCRLKPRPQPMAVRGRRKKAASGFAPALQLPRKWRETNPWIAFESGYRSIYEGKQETNRILKNAAPGRGIQDLESGQANFLIFRRRIGEIPTGELPNDSIDYALAATPVHPVPAGSLTYALWESWLNLETPAGGRLPPAPAVVRTAARAEENRHADFAAIRRMVKDGGHAHFTFEDVIGPQFHAALNSLVESGFLPERIVHHPAAGTPGRRVPSRATAADIFIVRCAVAKKAPVRKAAVSETTLRRKFAAVMKTRLILRGGASPEEILRAAYGQLDAEEISAFARQPADDLLKKAAGAFAEFRKGKFIPRKTASFLSRRRKTLTDLRRIILDAESIAPGGPGQMEVFRQAVYERMGSTGFLPEDFDTLRIGIGKEQVEKYRRNRFSLLLAEFGKIHGYRKRAVKGRKPGITWRQSGKGEFRFIFRRKEIQVQSIRAKKLPIEWGSISYFDLECGIREWCRTHPDRGDKLSRRLVAIGESADLPPEQSTIYKNTSPIADLRLKVVKNRKICSGHYLMELALPHKTRLDFLPGQFFHVVCDPDDGKQRLYPLTLRRPLSVHGAQYAGFPRSALAGAEALPVEIRQALVRQPVRIDFLYRVVGEGTQVLSRLGKGVFLDAIGPLGNGFSIGGERTAVIVAGGIGVAPLVALAERLRLLGKEVLIYLGAVRRDMLSLAVGRPLSVNGFDEGIESRDLLEIIRAEFLEIGARVLTICTDDGSAGEKGLVTEMLAQGIRGGCVPLQDVCLYACGPEGMLRTVAEIAARHSLPCQVSLEQRMACGIGACYSCTVDGIAPDGAVRKQRVCREGPVFPAKEIQWKD